MLPILDPTDERVPVQRWLAERPEALQGTVALLDISKPRGDIFLDRLEERLQAEALSIQVRRFTKPTYTKPAPAKVLGEIKEVADFVIEALAD